jgi:hypothetical protein
MDTYDLMPLSATDSCAQTSAGYVCTKALEHVGEHATHTAGGVVIKRWPNTQITPGDAVKDAAPASSGAPSLVELDRKDAEAYVLERALMWQAHRHTPLADTMADSLDRAVKAYREVQS